MNYGEVKRLLKKHGCSFVAEGGRHEKWYSPITGETFPVSRHNQEEAARGTLKSILRAAGVKLPR